MPELPVEKIYFIDDSGDEFFLSTLLFERNRIDLEIEHYRAMDDFFEATRAVEPKDMLASLIVVDLNLTIGKGTEGLRRLRGQQGGSDLIAGICSGSEDPADAQNAFQAGADFFVAKPLDIKSLAAICESVSVLEMRGGEDQGIKLVKQL